MGFSELLILGAIALIFIGPKQLPEVARVIARLINELKRATGDIGSSFMDVRRDADQILRDTQNSILKSLDEKPKEKVEANAEPKAEVKDDHGKS